MSSVNKRTLNLTLIGIFVALLCICSYIQIPFAGIPFTLQTFALYFCLFCLGQKRALIAVCMYILMGLVGIPVFSGFTGGIGALLGFTGGFVLGFPLSIAICGWLMRIMGQSFKGSFISALISLPVCHITGVLWFCLVYFGKISPEALVSSFTICSLPFIIPDVLKLLAAALLGTRIKSILGSI